jgi:hypothetical protein
MFIGHRAVAFAAKRAAPRVSLGVLVGAASLLDLLWSVFLLPGWEVVRVEPGDTAASPLAFVRYPISHSLVAAVGWSTLRGLLYWGVTRSSDSSGSWRSSTLPTCSGRRRRAGRRWPGTGSPPDSVRYGPNGSTGTARDEARQA